MPHQQLTQLSLELLPALALPQIRWRWRRLHYFRKALRLLRLYIPFNFRAKSHAPIAVRIRLSVHDARLAMGLFRIRSRHFRGHPYRRLDRHSHLQWRGRHKEKSATRNVNSLGKMLATIPGQPKRAKTKRDSCTKALELSAFYGRHWGFPAG